MNKTGAKVQKAPIDIRDNGARGAKFFFSVIRPIFFIENGLLNGNLGSHKGYPNIETLVGILSCMDLN